MVDEMKLQRAQRVFETMCRTLDSHEWKYEKNDEKLTIACSARGEDLPMEFIIDVDPARQVLILFSKLPVIANEDKRLDMTLAVSMVNNKLVDGNFDFDIRTGNLLFRATNSFVGNEISSELLTYMIFGACAIVDEYNDRFLMLNKGLISLESFISDN